MISRYLDNVWWFWQSCIRKSSLCQAKGESIYRKRQICDCIDDVQWGRNRIWIWIISSRAMLIYSSWRVQARSRGANVVVASPQNPHKSSMFVAVTRVTPLLLDLSGIVCSKAIDAYRFSLHTPTRARFRTLRHSVPRIVCVTLYACFFSFFCRCIAHLTIWLIRDFVSPQFISWLQLIILIRPWVHVDHSALLQASSAQTTCAGGSPRCSTT